MSRGQAPLLGAPAWVSSFISLHGPSSRFCALKPCHVESVLPEPPWRVSPTGVSPFRPLPPRSLARTSLPPSQVPQTSVVRPHLATRGTRSFGRDWIDGSLCPRDQRQFNLTGIDCSSASEVTVKRQQVACKLEVVLVR